MPRPGAEPTRRDAEQPATSGTQQRRAAMLWTLVFDNRAATALSLLALLGLAVVLQQSQPIGHDVGWLLVATEQLLAGANVYVDAVIEVNPPLILFLLSPPVAIAQAVDVSPIPVLRLWVFALATGALLLAGRALVLAPGSSRPAVRGALAVLAAWALLVFADQDFAQREHFILIFALPFLAASAVRASGRNLPRGLAVACGVGWGIAVALKPHYAVALVGIELYVATRTRSVGSLLRPEFVAAASTGLLYAAAVVWLTPGYLEVVAPIAIDAYWAYRHPLAVVARQRDVVLLLCGLGCALVLARSELRDLAGVLATAALGFYAALLIQGTGWPYHRLPFHGVLIALLALPVLALVQRVAPPRAATPGLSLRIVAGFALAALLLAGIVRWQPFVQNRIAKGARWRAGDTTGLTHRIRGVIDLHAAGEPVYFLTPALAIPFPAVNYSKGTWASRFSCLWPLPAVVRARAGDPSVPGWLDPARVDALETTLRDAVVEDLEHYAPRIIFFDRRTRHQAYGGHEVDVLEFFLEDPRFASIWARYAPSDHEVGPFSFARRRGAPDEATGSRRRQHRPAS